MTPKYFTGETNTSPASSEVDEFKDVGEDLPDVGHVEQHERHAYDGVQDGSDFAPLGPWRQVAISCTAHGQT